MSRISFIASQSSRTPWKVWIMILIFILLLVAGILIYVFLTKEGSPLGNSGIDFMSNSSLPV